MRRKKKTSNSCLSFFLVEEGGETRATGATASAARSDETDLLAGGRVTTDGRRDTKMLVVTTSVRMVDGVHRHTLHDRPAVALRLVLVVRVAGLEQGLVRAAATGDDTDHGAARRAQRLLHARRQLHARLALVGVVADDGRVVAARTRQRTTVAGLVLDVADDRTLGHLADGQHVADRQRRTLAAVHKLAGVHALRRDEGALHRRKAVRVAELHARKGRTTPGVVDDLAHHTLHVAVTLRVVDRAELRRTLPVSRVRLEDTTRTTTAATDNLTHVLSKKKKKNKHKKHKQKKVQERKNRKRKRVFVSFCLLFFGKHRKLLASKMNNKAKLSHG